MKKLLAVLLCIALLAAPAAAFAEGEVKGDLLGKGAPSIGSFSLLGQYLLGTKDLTESQKSAADMNGDGRISMADFALLGKVLLSGGSAGANQASPIIGTWRLQSVYVYGETLTADELAAADPGFANTAVTFNGDGTYTLTSGPDIDYGAYAVQGNTVILDEDILTSGKISGNTLTLDLSAYADTYFIAVFSK